MTFRVLYWSHRHVLKLENEQHLDRSTDDFCQQWIEFDNRGHWQLELRQED